MTAPRRAHPEGCAALRSVLVTVPRLSCSCEHFSDGFRSGPPSCRLSAPPSLPPAEGASHVAAKLLAAMILPAGPCHQADRRKAITWLCAHRSLSLNHRLVARPHRSLSGLSGILLTFSCVARAGAHLVRSQEQREMIYSFSVRALHLQPCLT